MHREAVVMGTEAVLLPRMEISGPVLFKVLGISFDDKEWRRS